MKSKILNLLLAIFMVFSLIASVGADGNLSNPVQDNPENTQENTQTNLAGEVTIEQIEVSNEETAKDYISEVNEFEGERIESIPLEDESSEKVGANSGQGEVVLEEAPTSSQEQDVYYVPLEEVSPETSSSLNQSLNSEGNLSNKSQNLKEGSGQTQSGEEKEVDFNETNQTTLPSGNLEENHTDVRGNTQTDAEETDSTTEFTSSASLSSLESAGNSGEKTIEYVSLSEITEEPQNGSNNEINQNKEETREKQLYSYYDKGKKVIEIETIEEVNINKEEFEKNEFEKKVVISSEEHVEDPLRVYVDMPSEVLKSKIKILWENEDNLEITDLSDFSVKYYDENGNGLVDRVSWIVPHLSEQIFQIIIEPDFVEKPGAIGIELHVDGPSGQVTNPIEFNVSINYSHPQFVECDLVINKTGDPEILKNKIVFQDNGTEKQNISVLDNGDYWWYVLCADSSDNSINTSKHGDFNVNELFQVHSSDKVYLVDEDNNLLGSSGEIQITSQDTSSVEVIIDRPGDYVNYTKIFSGSNAYSLTIDEEVIKTDGLYKVYINFGEPSANYLTDINFSVAKIKFILDESSIEAGEEKDFRVIVNSQFEKIQSLIFDYGPGENNNITFWDISTNNFDQTFSYTYQTEGDYLARVSLKLDGKILNLNVQSVEVVDSGDTSPPDIDLNYPGVNANVYDDEIRFKYTATDDVNLKKCIFTLYNVSNSTELKLHTQTDTPTNGKEFEVHMIYFDEGEYEWEVNCSDNSSNWDDNWNLFEVILSNSTSNGGTTGTEFTDYEQREDVENVLEEVNAFLLDEEGFGADIKEVLRDLGISEEISFYKKRLLQIDQYFKENYKYVEDQNVRAQKDKEYLEEFENIKNKIPKKIELKDHFEYVKNNVETSLEEVAEDYMKSTNTQVSKKFIKKLAQENLKLQQEITVKADIKSLKIEYANETKELILVKKTIDFKDSEHDQILEIIPKNIAEDAKEVTFLVDNQIIKKDPIFEVLKEDLTDDNEIIYYVEGFSDIKDFSKTETILFEESFSGKSGFTGFFAADIITNTDPIYFAIAIFLLILLVILFLVVSKKIRDRKWKKEPNVVKCFELMRKTNLYLKEKDVERARENYREIKRIYPTLPPKPKEYFYEKIKELSTRIDRRDIFGLVLEYEEAKKGLDKENCLRIYGKIKKVYERLPLKDRQKIYERISR